MQFSIYTKFSLNIMMRNTSIATVLENGATQHHVMMVDMIDFLKQYNLQTFANVFHCWHSPWLFVYIIFIAGMLWQLHIWPYLFHSSHHLPMSFQSRIRIHPLTLRLFLNSPFTRMHASLSLCLVHPCLSLSPKSKKLGMMLWHTQWPTI